MIHKIKMIGEDSEEKKEESKKGLIKRRQGVNKEDNKAVTWKRGKRVNKES